MIILRNKKFADIPKPGETLSEKGANSEGNAGESTSSQEVTSRDLQIEQMRLQKQLLLIQHQKQQMRVKEEMAKRRQLQQLSRMESEEKQSQRSNQVKVRKMEADKEKPDNTSLYKNRSQAVAPVPMKV